MTAAAPVAAETGRARQAAPLDASVEVYAVSRSNVLLKRGARLTQLLGPDVAATVEAGDPLGAEVEARIARGGWLAPPDRPPPRPRFEPPAGVALLDPFGLGAAIGFDMAAAGPSAAAALRVVLTDGFARPDLDAHLRAAVEGAPVVLWELGGEAWSLSPVFRAGHAPCQDCFRRRLLGQDDAAALILRHGLRPLERRRPPPAISSERMRAATAELARLSLACGSAGIVRIDDAGTILRRPAVPRPDCRACAPASGGVGTRVGPPPAGADLAERVESAVGRLVAPRVGLVSDVAAAPGTGVVAVAAASFADPGGGRLGRYALDLRSRLVRSDARSRRAFGAGRTAGEARAKAVLEALERYGAILRDDDPVAVARRGALGGAALDPASLTLDGAGPADDAPVRWSPVVSLDGETAFAPTGWCFDGVEPTPGEPRWDYCGNGGAIAFDRDDAIVRGFLELVERDATSIWWYGRIARPSVDLASFGDPFLDRFAFEQQARGRSLVAFDLTSDLEIPTFAALARGAADAFPLMGYAARFDAREALVAACLELGQALAFAAHERMTWRGFRWRDQPQLDGAEEVRDAAFYAGPSTPPSVAACAAAASRAGLEIFVCDHARTDVGLPAVKAIVPHLRPPGRRLAPGRLFDAPVRLGWRNAPIAACDLNPETLRL